MCMQGRALRTKTEAKRGQCMPTNLRVAATSWICVPKRNYHTWYLCVSLTDLNLWVSNIFSFYQYQLCNDLSKIWWGCLLTLLTVAIFSNLCNNKDESILRIIILFLMLLINQRLLLWFHWQKTGWLRKTLLYTGFFFSRESFSFLWNDVTWSNPCRRIFSCNQDIARSIL